MGFGLPAAIGAKAARPDCTVICIDGDGSVQMTIQEIATSLAEDLPVVVVVLNDGALGMVRQWQTMFFDGRLSQVGLDRRAPDFAALARAHGALGITVTDPADLDSALGVALASEITTIVDVHVDPDEPCYPDDPAGGCGRRRDLTRRTCDCARKRRFGRYPTLGLRAQVPVSCVPQGGGDLLGETVGGFLAGCGQLG